MEETKCKCNCGTPTEEELYNRLDDVINHNKDKDGALIPVLQIAQRDFWLFTK